MAFLPEEEFETHIEDGRLVRVLEQWCKPFTYIILAGNNPLRHSHWSLKRCG